MTAPIHDGLLIGPTGKTAEGTRRQETATAGAASFGKFLESAFNKVNQAQVNAEKAATALATGEIQDVHQVMIATEKANLALQLTITVRNKVIDAYQEISRMQI